MKIKLNQRDVLYALQRGLQGLGSLEHDEVVTAFELQFGSHGNVADYGLVITTETRADQERKD